MSIQLKEHNQETYKKVKEHFINSNRVAVIHPTGTGKSFVALKFLEDNKDKKAIYLAPSTAILHNVKKNIFEADMDMTDFSNLKRMTYKKLATLSDEEIEKLSEDIIILDEFHHCGAPEWGSGVNRLLSRNENAQVLGLSATPIRYFDKARDMAEEMFNGNVASEMSLEEAIQQGILPEATYVGALYAYNDELNNIQSRVLGIKDENTRATAQDMLNDLSKRLDENTQNLPNLLAQYMEKKNGKYIVFCRNIDDMKEKMETVKEIFGNVNDNITIYDVSSENNIRRNDKILSEFEADNNEETLKLMFSVNMLNEGYHINDLDGVVMMRPTFSPTIFTQQLGRALSVKGGEGERPVILDLVNNFDSCKIIEDFYERMRQYEGRQGEKEKSTRKSNFTIFDTTKEFREIADKITELTKRKTVSLDEKIEIFNRFVQTGEELTGQTIFEGYPIGQWGIALRYQVNNSEIDLLKNSRYQELEDLGILDRLIDSTIDEKIDAVIEWNNNYPKAPASKILNLDILRKYATSEENFEELKEKYLKMQRYYDYIRYRKYEGKLTPDQISRAKEGNVGGVFGLSTQITEQRQALAEEYRISTKKIGYIMETYGTMEEFIQAYREGKLTDKDQKILKDNLVQVMDINLRENKNLERLWADIIGSQSYITDKGFTTYSSDKLLEMVEGLKKDKERDIIKRVYGFENGSCESMLKISETYNVTRSLIAQKRQDALEKLCFSARQISNEPLSQPNYIFNPEEKKILDEIKDTVFDSNNIFYPDKEYIEQESNIDKDKIAKLNNSLKTIRTREEFKGITLGSGVEEIGLKEDAFWRLCLRRRHI